MMRGLILVLAVTAVDTEAAEAGCADRLDRTLTHMQERPLLKEEHATALMWLRMDAENAVAPGDERLCVEKVLVIERLLGLTANPVEAPSAKAPDKSGKNIP